MEPSMKPLAEWYCDTCGEVISSLDDGYIEWLATAQPSRPVLISDVRIIHNFKEGRRDGCHADDQPGWDGRPRSSLPLCDVTGGPTQLSSLLDTLGGPTGAERVIDPTVLHTVIRRLHVPYYEEARRYAGSEPTPIGVHELRALIRREGA